MKTRGKLEWDGKGLVKVPTMRKGQRYTGPEYTGCCNTGRRPQIIHCGYTGRYIVGVEHDVEAMRLDTLYHTTRRIHRKGDAVVWTFATRGAAVAKFSELCRVVTDYNRKTNDAMARDAKLAKRGDIAAALRMGEY
jgi:hypothetical protein